MKNLIAVGAVAAAVALAPQAHAADFYMNGVGGVGPGYSTITGPTGKKCAKGCQKLYWGNLDDDRAARVITEYVTSGKYDPTTDVGSFYSLSTNGLIKALNANPELGGTFVLYGSPSAPGSNNPESIVLTNTKAKVIFVTVEGDSVAQHGVRGATFGQHMRNYRRLDATTTPVSSTTVGNVTHNVYAKPDPWAWLTKLFAPKEEVNARIAAVQEDSPEVSPARVPQRAALPEERPNDDSGAAEELAQAAEDREGADDSPGGRDVEGGSDAEPDTERVKARHTTKADRDEDRTGRESSVDEDEEASDEQDQEGADAGDDADAEAADADSEGASKGGEGE